MFQILVPPRKLQKEWAQKEIKSVSRASVKVSWGKPANTSLQLELNIFFLNRYLLHSQGG